MSEKLRILSIGAHPADIFDQSGGTMAHHVTRGNWVGCCVLTHGARVHDQVISHEMFSKEQIPEKNILEKMMAERSDVKAKEVRKACAHIGVKDIYFFGADDAVLLPTEATVRKLATLIRELKPHIILTHHPYESGEIWSSHSVTGQIVMLAIGLAESVDPGDSNPPHHVFQVFFWGQGATRLPQTSLDTQRSFYNNICIDITDVIEKKIACMDELVSQAYNGNYARKRVETSDGAFGVAARIPYGESFISLRMQVYRYLPISEINLQMEKESEQAIREKYSYRIKV